MVTLADLTTGLHTVYQPIVDLRVGHSLVAVEALTRGAPGPLEPPARLFAAAAGAGLVRELDEACLRAALLGAPAGPGAVTLFVNVEPVTLAALTSPQLHELVALVPPSVRVVLEVTERDLMVAPAGLGAAVGGLRELGWGIALDDVGA
ncbi:MAG TPA: EAL domain-containing protein, partial [Actinomycetales bacterium]